MAFDSPTGRTARLYRMAMPDHLCPYGQKALWTLRRAGYEVEDPLLTTREETDAFLRAHGVKTTPQAFVGDERIGGYEDLRAWLGKPLRAKGGTSYGPVVALFGVAALVALALGWRVHGTVLAPEVVPWFISVAMVLLGLQKLRDVEAFSTMFLNYDLAARAWVPYGYVYPFAETGAGLLMLAGALTWLAAPVALTIGTIGAVSVLKAVYIDRRELRCACMGGDSNVPLGFVSLTENVMMAGMGAVMLAGLVAG